MYLSTKNGVVPTLLNLVVLSLQLEHLGATTFSTSGAESFLMFYRVSVTNIAIYAYLSRVFIQLVGRSLESFKQGGGIL